MVRYEAAIAPDGAIAGLWERSAAAPRPIDLDSPEATTILVAGREIVYRFDDELRLVGLPYPEVLEALRREVQLTAHKLRHGELLDEPETVPALQQLLARITEQAEGFARRCRSRKGGIAPDG